MRGRLLTIVTRDNQRSRISFELTVRARLTASIIFRYRELPIISGR